MVSKIANRRKLIGSRHRLRAGDGTGSPDSAKVAKTSIEDLQAEPAETVVKASDQLRLAALKALKGLEEFGTATPFIVDLEKKVELNEDGTPKLDANGKTIPNVTDPNQMEDRFFKRCESSTKLVNGMQEQLTLDRAANLEALKEAELALIKQKQSALKSQAALNFLEKKQKKFDEINNELLALKEQISKMVAEANVLNVKCTTELDETVKSDVRSTITNELKSLDQTGEQILDRLKEVLDKLAKDANAAEAAAAVPAANASAANAPADGTPADGTPPAGGRYRRSRNNNLRKRRSFNRFW